MYHSTLQHMPIARSQGFLYQTKGDCFRLQKITSILPRREVWSSIFLRFKVHSSQEHFDMVLSHLKMNYTPLLVYYSLFDRFHERNSMSPSNLLRQVTLVPKLNVAVNTEVEEQLHNSINCSNYSWNMMLPGNHLFMMHVKLHANNFKINKVYRKKINSFSSPRRATQKPPGRWIRNSYSTANPPWKWAAISWQQHKPPVLHQVLTKICPCNRVLRPTPIYMSQTVTMVVFPQFPIVLKK